MKAAAVSLAVLLLPASAAGAPWLRLTLASPAHTRVAAKTLTLGPGREAALRSEGHGYVDLLERHELVFRAGRVEETSTQVRHFLTDDGVRSGGNLTFAVSTA